MIIFLDLGIPIMYIRFRSNAETDTEKIKVSAAILKDQWKQKLH